MGDLEGWKERERRRVIWESVGRRVEGPGVEGPGVEKADEWRSSGQGGVVFDNDNDRTTVTDMTTTHWARELVFSQKDCEKTQFRLKIHTKFIKLCQTLSLLAERHNVFPPRGNL